MTTSSAPVAPVDHTAALVAQSALLAAALDGGDLAAPVAGCPGWDVGRLVRHVGGAHRWTEEIVRTRATGPVPEDINDPDAYAAVPDAALAGWFTEGAGALAAALRDAGPDAPLWTVAPGGTARFWARRMTYETAVHRYDVATALGVPYELDAAVARSGLDEWTEFSVLPQVFESPRALADLLRPGRTLWLRTTADSGAGEGAGWVLDLGGREPVRRPAAPGERATVTVTGTPADLLLLMYGRLTPGSAGIEVTGDVAAFNSWLYEVSSWLRIE
ncbi:maleylpyruvate isomerase family mycothiol-dependent enzyme [Streptomyces sp. NPDC004111]|uniref:maleylpyruvate isomerase family mycothiol-dependent enzyme n=1 Tax=Streptomyces sp. NPDC004111 TaxID=3364690 RepID=UPI0036A0D186